MTLKDVGIYKNDIMSLILNSTEIVECLLGDGYNVETVDEEIMYNHLFPFLYVNDVQTEEKAYICIEVDVPRTPSFEIKDLTIIIWCYCHKGIMKCSEKGYIGTRADILADMVDRLLNGVKGSWIGKLKLSSVKYISPSKDFYGKQLLYSCSDFNIKGESR